MTSKRHIFFDLDHTLWDFERNARECIGELLEEYQSLLSLPCDPDRFFASYSLINRELWDAYERREIDMEAVRRGRWHRAFAELDIPPGEWMETFGKDYVERCPHKPHLMDGAKQILETLSSDFVLGIISNGLSSNQFTKIENAGIAHFFQDVVTVDMAGHPKPDARMFHFAMERLGAHPHTAMYVGDTYESDVKGSWQAGMSSVYFNPHRQPNPLGVVEIQHLNDLPEAVMRAWRT
jgi:putative hydrolase of the HAD superfamily